MGYVITNTVCNAAMPCPNYMQVYYARTSSEELLEPATDPNDTPLLHQSGMGYVIANTVCNAAMPCPNYMQVY